MKVTPYESYYHARENILDFIRKDAFGPIQEEETLQEPPLDYYVCGILWPRKSSKDASESDQNDLETTDISMSDAGSEQTLDETEEQDVVREANQLRPSVMAISFALPAEDKSVEVSFTAGKYVSCEIHHEGKSYTLHEYKRTALDSGLIKCKLPLKYSRLELFDGTVVLRLHKRKKISEDRVLWTISVENAAQAGKNEVFQNCSSLFQCCLNLKGNFLPTDRNEISAGNSDRKKQDFLYRKKHTYAIGHGCAATWDSNNTSVSEIESTFLPIAFVPQMIAAASDGAGCFRMSSWNNERKYDTLNEFSGFIGRYREWKNQLSEQLSNVPALYRETAEEILLHIEECAERLDTGLRILQTNPQAWNAFSLMNLAMQRQSAKRRKCPDSEVEWYPFQLCYVLMCIPDIVDVRSIWRDMVDLLWFPTGGGKTEAYLGVAAFTIFYRRLTKGELGKGVTVLMRYTLRMLTSQQFERAASLICECDLIRRRKKIPGGEISIGLWVGSAVTPNHVTSVQGDTETAETILEKLRQGRLDEVKASPIQLTVCPYCGEPLTPQNAFKVSGQSFLAHCPSENCPFHDDLPIVTVDDDIYTRRPTLLIGTIDKFARLAWEDKTGAIFSEDGDSMPPELLIQDELHLISGPLGSISGLYEIAIQELCSRRGIHPKILASTATLCNAGEQIAALYGKKVFQFPPSGFDSDDSFFARTASKEEKPERLYLGYCETGGSMPDALTRVFGVARFAADYLASKGVDREVIDQFWTNIGYFNSLKDLGSADTMIIDRTIAYAESLRKHKFRDWADAVQMQKISNTYEHGELTSRKNAQEITNIRLQLDQYHYPHPASLNYVLSSNMLSVGIDINRLGLMTVYGQPKTTAEYIQATSRVGRSKPGFVVVLLNAMRTRDKGHYEQFLSYHQTLNRMVEPTSAMPYAVQTMDKALHAVFVILIRHRCPNLRTNRDASHFRASDPSVMNIRESLLKMIAERSPNTVSFAEVILDDFIARWEHTAISKGAQFQYCLLNNSENDTDVLLIPAERYKDEDFPPTMNSMRNVDTQSGVFMKRRLKR